jgi:nucleotide-binding universal stress UspA family protein
MVWPAGGADDAGEASIVMSDLHQLVGNLEFSMFDRILVAVDESDQAQSALIAGIELARLMNAQLTAVHVNSPPENGASRQTVDVKTQGLLRRLEKLPAATAICRNGQPMAEIVAVAEEIGAKLIVMGTHGRGPLKQLFLGSTAEGVARMAPCPVMTVQRVSRRRVKGGSFSGAINANLHQRPLFRRILVAMDASEPALAALGLALEFAHQVEGEVAIVHVANTAHAWLPPMTETGLAPLSEIRRHGQILLNRVVADLPKSARCETILRDGEPGKEVLTAAREWKADLIILGNQGYNHFQQFVLGSVASAVMRGASCPVLVVRPESLTGEPLARRLQQEASPVVPAR